MTCYPTSQSLAVQNEYTRVICEYFPLLPSPALSLWPLGISFTLRSAAGSSVRMWPPTYATTQPPVSHMLPPYIPRRPRHPPNLDTSQAPPRSKLNTASRHSSTQPLSSQCLIEHLPVPVARVLSSRRSTVHRIYLCLRSLSMGALLLSPSRISTRTATSSVLESFPFLGFWAPSIIRSDFEPWRDFGLVRCTGSDMALHNSNGFYWGDRLPRDDGCACRRRRF